MGRLFTIPTDLARLIAAQRKPKERSCQNCGRGFVTVGRGLYCTTACKRAAEWKRIRERTVGEQRAE